MKVATLGIDIGKTWFHVVGVDCRGKPLFKEKLNRRNLFEFVGKCERCLIGMEACAGSQYLARRLSAFGHEVKLIAPRFVKAYLKSNKNDFNDAAAIAEAVTRPTMRFVPVRSAEQLDLQALHRVRDQLIAERTGSVNQIRAFLLEYGLPVPVGRSKLQKLLPEILENGENGLSPVIRDLLKHLKDRLQRIDEEVDEVTHRIDDVAESDSRCLDLRTIPGIGLLRCARRSRQAAARLRPGGV